MSTTELDTTTTTEPTAQAHTWRRPRYDVLESDDAFDVRVSLPGVQREGVNISVDGDNLSITGHAHVSAARLGGGVRLRRELPEGDYRLNSAPERSRQGRLRFARTGRRRRSLI